MLITGPTEEARAFEDHPLVIRVYANDVHHNPVAVAEVHVQSLNALFFHQLISHQLRGVPFSDPLNAARCYPGLCECVTKIRRAGFDGEQTVALA